MWDWSKKPQTGKERNSASLLNVYDDLSPREKPSLITQFSTDRIPQNTSEEQVPNISKMQNIINEYLKKYDLHRMKLRKRDYTPQTWQEMDTTFREYQRMRSTFLKLVSYSSSDECQKLGLSETDISLMKDGIAPENYNTHLKIPFDFGGTLALNNFSLIKTHRTHSNIHRILDFQITCGFLLKYKKIFIPWFEGKIYHD